MNARPSVVVVALLLVTAGCPGPDAPDPRLCECLADSATGADASGCGPVICSVEAECEESGESSFTCFVPIVVNVPGLTCALEALRDGTPGVIEFDTSAAAGYASRSGYVVILENRQVITYAREIVDLNGHEEDAVLGSAPDASYFSGCLEAGLEEQMRCLDFVPVAPTLTCIEGENFSAF